MVDSRDARSISWAKPLIALRHLARYNIVVIMDADAYVKDMSQSVESVLDKFLERNKSILIGRDCLDRTFCWSDGPNTGVLIVKDSPPARALLEEWALAHQAGRACDPAKNIDKLEQGCLGELMTKMPSLASTVQLLSRNDTFTINSNDGSFIRHHLGKYGDERMKLLIPEFMEVSHAIQNL
jgi:hypothetical protein